MKRNATDFHKSFLFTEVESKILTDHLSCIGNGETRCETLKTMVWAYISAELGNTIIEGVATNQLSQYSIRLYVVVNTAMYFWFHKSG
jgi:uncharacterized membrane protein